MRRVSRVIFLNSEVDQNNTATIYQAYDTKESTAETPDSSDSKKEPKKKSKIEDTPHDLSVAANTSVLVLDKNGKVLNVVDKFSSLSNLPIDKNNIDVISKGSAQNYFDQTKKTQHKNQLCVLLLKHSTLTQPKKLTVLHQLASIKPLLKV